MNIHPGLLLNQSCEALDEALDKALVNFPTLAWCLQSVLPQLTNSQAQNAIIRLLLFQSIPHSAVFIMTACVPFQVYGNITWKFNSPLLILRLAITQHLANIASTNHWM